MNIMGPRHIHYTWSDGEDESVGTGKGVERQGQDGKKYKRAVRSAVTAE